MDQSDFVRKELKKKLCTTVPGMFVCTIEVHRSRISGTSYVSNKVKNMHLLTLDIS